MNNPFINQWSVQHSPELVDIEQQLQDDVDYVRALVSDGGENRLCFWSSHPALVVGKAETRLPQFELAQNTLQQRGWTVCVRPTGGTAFPQCAQVLNLSATLYYEKNTSSIKQSYQAFCDVLIDAFSRLGLTAVTGELPEAFCDGEYNILFNQRKVVGTAQRWVKHQHKQAVLAHAAILVNTDSVKINQVVNDFYQLSGSERLVQASALTSLDEQLCEQQTRLQPSTSSLREQLVKALTEAFTNTN